MNNFVKVLQNGNNAFAVLSEFVNYANSAAQHRTEREGIAARRDVAIKALENDRELILDYFSKRFAERWFILDESFKLLHSAVTDKNDRGIDAALQNIQAVIGDNPLNDFEKFKDHRQAGRIIEI